MLLGDFTEALNEVMGVMRKSFHNVNSATAAGA